MSETDKKPKDTKVGWVYRLSKDQVIEQLLAREQEVNENAKLDELRKALVKVLRETEEEKEIESSESASTSSDENTEMATSEDAKLKFVFCKDDWEIFIDRLEILFTVKDTKDEKKAAVMLTRFDEDAFKLVKNLCAPIKPAAKKYDELKQLMQDHLAPAPSEVMERCNFNQAR
uniref:Uncharacterized protein n=1 Tax=Trichogramma kaykai TaxID=54128 RepID=A0ABD2WPZ5_9HYME